jgi:hypothetical protein
MLTAMGEKAIDVYGFDGVNAFSFYGRVPSLFESRPNIKVNVSHSFLPTACASARQFWIEPLFR